eukprot:TRINITY_DN1182_c0_g1_i3.p1 TRINITY_DN1182_c0_g1~~TRINITY_DN1182_c0_g1_i3.p1  ORF type:complete len:560 (-),score=104.04 TRINITY_DN1182_c0_g1_i3:19-1626(-)
MCAHLFIVSLTVLAASASDAPAQPVKGATMLQTKLRGSKSKEAITKQLITSQRYSDDDESCSANGVTPGVCALASLAHAPSASPASLFSSKETDFDKQESVNRLERALLAEIESGLAGNHTGFGPARLQLLERELQPLFASLPHEPSVGSSEGGLGFAAARYLLHQHFVRQHSRYVRGLNPAGDGRKLVGGKEALRSNVARQLLEVMEKKVGEQGLDLRMLAILAATLEHLFRGDEHEFLKQSWAAHSLQPDSTTDAPGLVSVLEVFIAHFVVDDEKAFEGHDFTLQQGRQEVNKMSDRYPGWPRIHDYIRHKVTERSHVSGKLLSFQDADSVVDEILLLFKEVSDSNCHVMADAFVKLNGGDQGRVKLAELQEGEIGDLFREPIPYLRELGALDESEAEPQLLMTNYLLAPSNCDGATSFYDLCCPNACETHKEHIEAALYAASDHVSAITKVVQQRLATVLAPVALTSLKALSRDQGGRVQIHGRAFADWLHKVFPRDCPRPREADFKGKLGDVLPDAQKAFQAVANEDAPGW